MVGSTPPPGPDSRHLILMRHGITGHNASGIWQGHLDTTLSDLGIVQARTAAAALAAYQPHHLVSSDLARAADTAREVADVTGLELTLDHRLREVDVGGWQGLTTADIDERYPGVRAAVEAGEDLRRGGDGELLTEVAVRVRAALDDLFARMAPGETAIVVTHGVSARVITAELNGWDQQTTWRTLAGLGNCHWAHLQHVRGRWRLYAWNLSAGPLVAADVAEKAY